MWRVFRRKGQRIGDHVNRVRRELLAYLDALVALWPGTTGERLRVWWISRRVGGWGGRGSVGEWVKFQAPERMRFGRGVMIGAGSFFAADGVGTLVVGDRVAFNTNVHINASVGGSIRIGDDCLFGPNVVLRSADHRFDRTDVPIRNQGHSFADIEIDNDVWIGANVTVVGGVHIGKGAVVGAGAVVTRDVADMVMVGGVPAKVIRARAGEAATP